MSLWDSAVAAANKAANHAGQQAQVAATKAKLHADLLVIDRDVTARKEKFGVEMYAHLEAITSTQEFYVADDRLINVIRPTLIKAQREVAAYERKRDALVGKVNAAEANRTGSASIFTAATISEKFMNAAKYAAAGAKEAASKTELAMIDRQILGFKEEFGTEMYPVFQSMEDNEGWLPTDRKVRSLYDSAREDIMAMEKTKFEKGDKIKKLDGVEGSGLTPPTVPASQAVDPTPSVVATPVTTYNNQPLENGQPSWYNTDPQHATTDGYGATQPPVRSYGTEQMKQMPPQMQQSVQQQISGSGFGFTQSTTQPSVMSPQPTATSIPQNSDPARQQPMLDPFNGLPKTGNSSYLTSSNNAFDPFSGNSNNQATAAKSNELTDADMNLFKY